MEMENRKLSYYSLEPHLFILRTLGYYQIDPKSPKLQKKFHQIYMRITLILIIIYTIQQAARVYEVRDDMDKVMETMFLFLTHTDSIYKQTVMWLRADQIEELLNIMRGPLYNQIIADHRKHLLGTARHGKFLLRTNNTLAVITCFLWVVYPLIVHIQGKHVEFAIWLPFNVNANPQFYISILYVWIMTTWLAICNTAMDVMVAVLLSQSQIQLFLLRDNLTKLVQRSVEETFKKNKHYSSTLYEENIYRRFVIIIKHHREIVRFAQKVQDIFGMAVAYQFLASAWIICTSVYKMVQIKPLSVQFLSMFMYILCMLIQLFLYCYYGSQVSHESEMLIYSAYGMDWLKIPLKYRRQLIFFMERIKIPIQPLAGFIIPLSNNTFISIVRSSYTFYAILKNASE